MKNENLLPSKKVLQSHLCLKPAHYYPLFGQLKCILCGSFENAITSFFRANYTRRV